MHLKYTSASYSLCKSRMSRDFATMATFVSSVSMKYIVSIAKFGHKWSIWRNHLYDYPYPTFETYSLSNWDEFFWKFSKQALTPPLPFTWQIISQVFQYFQWIFHSGVGICPIPYLSCNVFTNTKCLAMTGLEPAQIATGLEPAMFRSKL